MRLLLMIALIFTSFSALTLEFEGQYTEPTAFEKITGFEKNYWNQSANVCYAQTVCPNGMPIYCQVYGYQYVANGAFSNACNWFVIPGQGVRCQGYQQQMGPYGYFWAWVDIPVSCF